MVDGDAHHLEAFVLELGIGLLHIGQLPATRTTPRSPEVEQHVLLSLGKLGEIVLLSVVARQLEGFHLIGNGQLWPNLQLHLLAIEGVLHVLGQAVVIVGLLLTEVVHIFRQQQRPPERILVVVHHAHDGAFHGVEEVFLSIHGRLALVGLLESSELGTLQRAHLLIDFCKLLLILLIQDVERVVTGIERGELVGKRRTRHRCLPVVELSGRNLAHIGNLSLQVHLHILQHYVGSTPVVFHANLCTDGLVGHTHELELATLHRSLGNCRVVVVAHGDERNDCAVVEPFHLSVNHIAFLAIAGAEGCHDAAQHTCLEERFYGIHNYKLET